MNLDFLSYQLSALPEYLACVGAFALGAVSTRGLWASNPIVQKFRGAKVEADQKKSDLQRAKEKVPAGGKTPATPEPPKAPAEGKKKWFGGRRKPKDTSLQDLSKYFKYAVDRLKGVIEGKTYLYDRPWFLMIGESEVGKSTILKNSSMTHWSAPFADEYPGEKFCSFWLSDQAVVLDIPGEYILGADGKSNDRGWHRLMGLLRKYRYQRPIDGILFAIPATEINAAGEPTQEEIGRKVVAISRKLQSIERDLGMCVPVYVIVTKSDRIPGFNSFCDQLPEHRHDEIFGWSNPSTLDTGYTSQWVEEAFHSMAEVLYPTQLEMFAELPGGEPADELFLFPTEFQSLMPGVQAYTDQIFRPSSYHHKTLLMRGIYFVGDSTPKIPEHAAKIVSELELITSGVIANRTNSDPLVQGEPKLSFVEALFTTKVFPEYAIAYPLTGNRLAKNRVVLAIQILIVSIFLAGILAYLLEYPRLERSAAAIKRTLDTINMDLAMVNEGKYIPRADYVSYAEHILDGLSSVENNRLMSPLFPSSWFSPLHSEIQQAMGVAYEKIIMKAMKYQLEQKAESIPRESGETAPFDSTGSFIVAVESTIEFRDLRRYVDNLQQLELHYKKYNDLKKSQSLEDVRRLVQYLFNRELSDDFLENGDYYRNAIRYVKLDPFNADIYREKAVVTAAYLMGRLQDRMFTYNVILAYVRSIVNDVNFLVVSSNGNGIESVDKMRALGQNISSLKSALVDPRTAWISRQTFRPDSALQKLLTDVDSSVFLRQSGLQRTFLDSCDFKFRFLYKDILEEPSDIIGPVVFTGGENVKLQLTPTVDSLRSAVVELLGQRFMRAVTRERISNKRRTGNLVLWNGDQLSEALKLQEPYGAFVDKGLDKFHPRLRDPARNAARNGLEATMIGQINPAQRVQPAIGSTDDLKREIGSLKAVTPQFERLLSLFDQLQLPAYSDLRLTLQQQGVAMLGDVTKILRNGNWYTIEEYKFTLYAEKQRDNVDQPLGAVLLDAGDEAAIADWLVQYHEQIQKLAMESAEPILGFLSSVGAGGTDDIRRWQKIVAELHKYESKAPGNSISTMEGLFLDLNNITQDNYAEKLIKKGTSDYFLEKREILRSELYRLFTDLVSIKAKITYRELRKTFNEQLAGKFPFAEFGFTSNLVRSASVEEVRSFFQAFNEFRDRYKPIWTGWGRTNASRAEDSVYKFINKMIEVEYFLAPLLSTAPDKQPALPMDVEFRVNYQKEIGGNQIIDWRLEIGNQQLDIQDNITQNVPLRAMWEVGDKIRVVLRWAKNAEHIPSSVTLGKGVILEDGRTVVYSFNDPWSLVRLLSVHRPQPGHLGRNVAPQPLEFIVRTVHNVTSSDDALLYSTPEQEEARVFIRVGVLGQNRRESLSAPYFPTTFAPALP